MAAFTPGPWAVEGSIYEGINATVSTPDRSIALVAGEPVDAVGFANARLIAAAPDHALICWAMCVQDGRWEEWSPYDGRGEFVFAGLRYATRVDDFDCPELTPALRKAISKARKA